MTNHIVTAATAYNLKDMGYPQPEPQAGQFWYDKKGRCLFLAGSLPGTIAIVLLDSTIVSASAVFLGAAYAPCATEIMEQQEMAERDLDYCPDMHVWRIFNVLIGTPSAPYKNPAEAAASEYLKLKRNL
jgi:hypothetical protein